MTLSNAILGGFFVFLSLTSAAAAGETPSFPLRWENVEGEPFWAGGVRPRLRARLTGPTLHVFEMPPRQELWLHLPPRSCLRLLFPEDGPAELAAHVSDGYRLEREVSLVPSADHRSLFLPAGGWNPRLVRLSNPRGTRVTVAIFVGRLETSAANGSKWIPCPLPGPITPAPREVLGRGEALRLLGRGEALRFELEGPRRYRLRVQLVSAPEAEPRARGHRLELEVGGHREEFPLASEFPLETPIEVLPGSGQVLASARHLSFEVPPGRHAVTIRTDARVALQLLGEETRGLWGPARPPSTFWPILAAAHPDPAQDARPTVANLLGGSARRDQRAQLLAALKGRQIAERSNAHPDDIRLGRSLYRVYSFYRDLHPHLKMEVSPPVTRSFVLSRLSDPLEPPRAAHLWRPRGDVAALPRGTFYRVASAPELSGTFAWPRPEHPCLLRLVVHWRTRNTRTPPTELHLEADDRPMATYRLTPPPPGFRRAVAPTDASLAARLQELEIHTVGLSGAALSRGPTPLTPVAFSELWVPAGTERLRIWASDPDTELWVAFQARTGREGHDLETVVARANGDSNRPRSTSFWDACQEWKSRPEPGNVPLGWSSTLRFVTNLEASLAQRVTPLAPPPSPDLVRPIDDTRAYLLRREAEELEKDGRWLSAAEAWSELTRSPRAAGRRQAESRRVRALRALGEDALADRQLLGLYLHHGDPLLRSQAREDLITSLGERGDHLTLRQLFATSALREGTPERFRELVEELLRQGFVAEALLIGATLPQRNQPIETLVQGAFELGWDTLLHTWLRKLALPRREFWAGLDSARHGEPELAERHLGDAGPAGRRTLERLQSSRAIRRQLTDPDLVVRARGVIAWEAWDSTLEEPPRERLDATVVVDHAGAVQCRVRAQSARALYFRGTPTRAFRARVLGPAKIRIETRPVHRDDAVTPMDGWLELRFQGRLVPVPLTGNTPSRSFEPIAPGRRPGVEISTPISLGPGLHVIELRPTQGDVLTRVRVSESALPLAGLPEWAPDHVAAVLAAGAFPLPRASGPGVLVHGRSAPVRLATVELPTVFFEPEVTLARLRTRDPLLAARLLLRIAERAPLPEEVPYLELVAGTAPGISADERSAARDRLSPGDSTPDADAVRLARGLYRALLESPRPADPKSAATRLEMLHYIAQKDPALQAQALMRAFDIERLHPARAREDRRTWKRLSPTIPLPRRTVTESGWKPESPRWRVRHCLLPPLEEGARLVAGDRRLGLALDNLAPAILRLDFEPLSLRFAPGDALVAWLQVDDESPRALAFDARALPRAEVIALGVGHHRVRVWLDSPGSGSYLRVSIREISAAVPAASGTWPPEPRWEPEPTRRAFHVATHLEPLLLTVDGPTWLRIHEKRGERTRVSYRSVAAGRQDVVLEPDPEHSEALYRVFQLDLEERARREFPGERLWKPDPSFPDSPLPRFELEPFPRALDPHDAFPLGGQEDGTWSLEVSRRRRRLFDEDTDGELDVDEYFETRGVHRYYSERHRVYFESGLLSRAHDSRGPTAGAWHRWTTRPGRLPVVLDLDLQGYVQWPDADRFSPTGASETSLSFRGRMERRFRLAPRLTHTPSTDLFARHSSLEDDTDYAFGSLDPDIYSDYRADHRWGARVSERVQFDLRLDTQLFSRATLTSNENFGVDQWRTGVGVRHFFRGLEASAGYEVVRFLNDEDRNSARTRQRLSGSVRYDLWVDARHRLELGCRVEQDLTDGETGFVAFFTWHFGNGRRYRDHAPRDVPFRALREDRIPGGDPNRIEER